MSKPEIIYGAIRWYLLTILSFCSISSYASNGQDTIPPVLTSAAMTQTVTCSLSDITAFDDWYLTAGGATAVDNSDTLTFIGIPDLLTARTDFIASSDTLCGNTKASSVTFFAVDTCGNRSLDSTTAFFFTIDTLRPFLLEEAKSKMLACGPGIRDSLDVFIRSAGNAVAGDNCADTVSLTNYFWNDSNGNGGVGMISNGSTIPISRATCDWSVMVSFLLSDDCGNIIATTASFAIEDTIAPVLDTLPPDITVQCDAVPPNDIVAFDDCDITPTLVFDQSDTQSSDSLSCDFYNYTIMRSWTATDVCGNSVSHSQTITVIDTLVPNFMVPPDLSIDCSDIDNLDIALGPIALDEPCGIALSTYIDTVMGGGCSYDIKRTWLVADPCGNDSSLVQLLTVTDTTGPSLVMEASNLEVSCNVNNNFDQSFSDWLANMGGAVVTDLCSNFDSFAAVPGSYDLSDSTSYPGTTPTLFSALSCQSATPGVVDSLVVDFVYFDQCGNNSLSTASFIIIDTIAPVFIEDRLDTILTTTEADCQASYDLVFPDFEDACIFDQTRYEETILRDITSSTPGSNDAVVDTVILNFNTTNSFINPITGNISLVIFLDNIDTDDPNEFFILVDENDTVLDSTMITSSQCGDQVMTISNLTVTQLNDWAQDGVVTFRLIPNIDPAGAVFSINDVCDFSQIRATLGFDIAPSSTPQRAFIVDGSSIEGGIDTSVILNQGIHIINYQITDCGGNQTILSQQVEVIDGISPVITCPTDTIIFVPDTACVASFMLATSIEVNDNCGGDLVVEKESPNVTADRLIRFVPNLTLGMEIASNRQFIFDSVAPIRNATVAPQIEVFIQGDINDVGEFYSLLGEDGTTLAATAIATDLSCGSSLTTTSLSISVAQFNDWVSDSMLIISAVANIDPSVDGGGINPCGILAAGADTDGVSQLWAKLSYADYDIEYEVNGSTSIPRTKIDSSEITLDLGSSDISYFAADASGNMDSCIQTVMVRDTFAPIVNCTDFVAFVHPSGLIDYVLQFDSLDTGSSDNCMVVDTFFSRQVFTCDDVGNEFDVSISLADQSGNIDSCTAAIRVEMAVLTPSFTTGVCEDDTLKLFANVPEAPIANAYTFSWVGPNGFNSSLENPFILNADDSYSGTYTLEVTGFNGCLSRGTIVVNVEQLVTPTVTPNAAQVCVDDEVLLTTNSFSGDLEYKWYEGQFPNGVLLQTTQNASLVLSPTVGDHFYYVIIESDNCVTNASASIMVSVLDPPVATVTEPFLTICEGSDLSLSTDIFNPFYEYFWSGPDDYESTGQFPEVIQDVDIDQQGQYSLVIKFGSCISDTANVQVAIFDQPIQPQITSDGLFCEGSTIVMSINNLTDADQYTWINDGQVFTNTGVNTLVLSGAQTSFGGEWQVIAREGICTSDTSEIEVITVEEEIQIGATNNGPACEGDSIQLTSSLIPNAEYTWLSPTNDTFNVQNPKVIAQQGIYTLIVKTASGCESVTSTTVAIETRPSITALSSDATDCIEAGQDIQFFPSIFPDGNYDYVWTGPVALSNEKNPIITDATTSANGIYSLTVRNGTCESNTTTLTLSVDAIPDRPEILAPDAICEGDSLWVTLAADYASDILFEWTTPEGVIMTMTDSLLLSPVTTNASGNYAVIAINGDCRSIISEAEDITIVTAPLTPTISIQDQSCEGDTVRLVSSIMGVNISYAWTGPNGASSTDSILTIANADSNNNGNYTLIISENGCESDVSNTIDLMIETAPEVPVFAAASYDLCIAENAAIELCISPDTYLPGLNYTLYINGQPLTTTSDSCYILDVVSLALATGSFDLEWQAADGDCRSAFSSAATLTVEDEEPISAMITADQETVCSGEEVLLSIEGIQGNEFINWSSASPDINIADSEAANTTVSNLNVGFNKIYVELGGRICSASFRDSIVIEVLSVPEANDDSFTLEYNQSEFLDILENDLLSRDYSFNIIQDVDFGTVEFLNGIVRFTSDERFIEEQIFIYEICYQDCPDICSEAIVRLEVNIDLNCAVPSIITPNEDGINDALQITCLSADLFPRNELIIFNQYGDEVFGASPYTNNWKGTYNGNPLPVGTYYYVFDRGDGSRPLNGFIMIQR